MSRGYVMGLATGLAMILAGMAWMVPVRPAPLQAALAEPVMDRLSPPVVHGDRQTVALVLENRGREPMQVESLRAGAEFVTLELPDGQALPIAVAAGQSATLPLAIDGVDNKWGPQEVNLEVVVSNGRQRGELRGMLLCQLVGPVNPDPPLVSFGRVARTAEQQPASFRLWSPVGRPKLHDYSVDSYDPAVVVGVRPIDATEADRHFFCEVTVLVNPRDAQAQHRSEIAVHSKELKRPLSIPVVGWVEP